MFFPSVIAFSEIAGYILLRTFKDEIISGITIKDIIITIKTTKTIDRLIAKISFTLLFFFKYLTIGSKRMAIKIAIIKVIKYPVHLPIIVEKLCC